jgi:hypothetical protein
MQISTYYSPLIQVNGCLDRHTRAQPVQVPLVGVEADAHGQALHNFYIIASCVLGRKETGPIACRGRHVLDFPIEGFV